MIQVATDLLNPKFNVKKIYTKEDRSDYIKKFPKSSKPSSENKAPKPWQFTKSSSTIQKPKLKPNPTDRDKLIPKSCILKITNPKVNAIYYELQKLRIENFTNAVAVLYRVFIELSIDCYIEKHKLATTPSSTKSGADLQQKIYQVANHLETKNFADAAICKGIKTTVKDKNSLLGIDTWGPAPIYSAIRN